MCTTCLMNCLWTLDNPMASLSMCHVGLLLWMAVLLNVVFGHSSMEVGLSLSHLG